MDTKKCLECGNMFSKKYSVSQKKWATAKYCSYKCSLVYTTVKKQKNSDKPTLGKVPWNKGLHIRISLNSGFKKGQVGYWKGKERLNLRVEKKERIIIYCKQCGKEKRLAPWETGKLFCNITCYGLWHRGINSPVFKGEEAVSRFRNRIAELPEYKEWHALILKRDNYRCVLCSSREKLEVDHIKRFLFIVQENNLKTSEDARNCKELWDISNGRTLCRICHRISDTYGTTGLKKSLA